MSDNPTVELIEELGRRTASGEIRWRVVSSGDGILLTPASYCADTSGLALTLTEDPLSAGQRVRLLIEDAESGETLRTYPGRFPASPERDALEGLLSEVRKSLAIGESNLDQVLLDRLRKAKSA